ncbi:MAG: hypothetical protein LBT53_04605 [Puniceicoccales bacterium]|nr:hypothetical protein [Puniceicoccales bacterium]
MKNRSGQEAGGGGGRGAARVVIASMKAVSAGATLRFAPSATALQKKASVQ